MGWIGEIDLGTKAAPVTGPMVSLTIDDQAVDVPEGTSIMRAAAMMGTSIPKLCATDSLESFGSCRLCLVEIDGRAGYPASCTTPVAPGMVVRTQTEKLEQLRALEHGIPIRVVRTTHRGIGVDTPADAARVEKILKKKPVSARRGSSRKRSPQAR